MKTEPGQIAASQVQQVAGMVKSGLAAGLEDVHAPETALDRDARELREKVYGNAGKSFDALLELVGSDGVAPRTRLRVHETVVKLAIRDMHEVAKLRLERERMLLEAEAARLDREAKERDAERDARLGRAGPQIVVVDSETAERARLAAAEQERLRGAGE